MPHTRRQLLARSALMSTLIGASLTLSAGAALAAPKASAPQVRFSTSQGDFVIEVYPDKAPKTVANFLQYVRSKHYDGTVFHRVINNFMIQGGGYDTRYVEKATRAPVPHEGRQSAKAGLRNTVGTVAMARTNDPNSGAAQFFINVKDNSFLDPVQIPDGDPVAKFEYQGRTYTNVPRSSLLRSSQLYGYTVFGKVVSGMDVVNRIKAVPTGGNAQFPSDVPKQAVVINSATQIK